MLKEARLELINGITINNFKIYCNKETKGRFKEETNMSLFIKYKNEEDFLLNLKLFYGRGSFYKEWVEIYNINTFLSFLNFFDSIIEEEILRFFYNYLENEGKLFIEYYKDRETVEQLERNYPIISTRIGFKLFKIGFINFKDWYFAEGFYEGGQKIQAEKNLNSYIKLKFMKEIYYEIIKFVNKNRNGDEILKKSISYSNEILKILKNYLE
ncbi:MAG: DUF1122 family protein [Thermoproteota archaeon]|jgi:hypothetical protein|nr:DUF1122 family protein [Thermoproteota archaeon]